MGQDYVPDQHQHQSPYELLYFYLQRLQAKTKLQPEQPRIHLSSLHNRYDLVLKGGNETKPWIRYSLLNECIITHNDAQQFPNALTRKFNHFPNSKMATSNSHIRCHTIIKHTTPFTNNEA